uniref:Uncharacterized protein n=1 Tax=Plectus sambesii TaxID=2011161 RepID=A0A914VG72_9BILA
MANIRRICLFTIGTSLAMYMYLLLTATLTNLSQRIDGLEQELHQRFNVRRPLSRPRPCRPPSSEKMKALLGSAYDERYMRLTGPRETSLASVFETTANFGRDFDFNMPNEIDPSTDTDPPTSTSSPSRNRTVSNSSPERRTGRFQRFANFPRPSVHMPWQCKTEDSWIALGPSYYPSFVKSVRCVADKCIYGSYYCRPAEPYQIKVLRLIRDGEPCTPESPVDENNPIVGRLMNYLNVFERNEPEPSLNDWEFETMSINIACKCGV